MYQNVLSALEEGKILGVIMTLEHVKGRRVTRDEVKEVLIEALKWTDEVATSWLDDFFRK